MPEPILDALPAPRPRGVVSVFVLIPAALFFAACGGCFGMLAVGPFLPARPEAGRHSPASSPASQHAPG